MNKEFINIHWFRRDLRLDDNAALFYALKQDKPVFCLFIFDNNILSQLTDKSDARVSFIFQEVTRLKRELEQKGSSLIIKFGDPVQIWEEIISRNSVNKVFSNHDYEPYGIERDQKVKSLLDSKGIEFKSYKDQVIFEKNEILKDDGTPYTVFTPYSKKWKSKLNDFYLKSYPSELLFNNLLQTTIQPDITLSDIGFEISNTLFPSKQLSLEVVKNYNFTRDIPSIEGTSRLSLHFRFGTVSIRKMTKIALNTNEKWLNELIWREFYMSILFHFPRVVHESFKTQYDRIEWKNNPIHFQQWCNGETGYPIVDAGMRQLNSTGFMHNRIRMVVASFLTKHLLIDWRWGEAYFAQKLLDFELASNNGGWQWAAGSGVDAAPYFRIFNPYLQTLKFDPQHLYIRQWVPEFDTKNYSKPIVNHEEARKLCLDTYKKALI